MYLFNNDFKSARKLIEEGIATGDYDNYTYYRHANVLRSLKDKNDNFRKETLNEAIYYFKKYAEIYPFDDLPYRRIGSCYFRNNNFRRALKSYKVALKLNPDLPDNYMNLVEVQLMEGEYNNASLNLEELKKIGFTGRFAEEDELITDYLYLIANMLDQNMMNDALEDDYDQVSIQLQKKGVENFIWNFKTFENWLDEDNRYTRDIDPDIKYKILLLTIK